MNAEDFLDLLEQRGIIPPIDIESLREQVAEAEETLHPVFVARRLVQAGYINPYFAKTLLSEGGIEDDQHPDNDEPLTLADDEEGEESEAPSGAPMPQDDDHYLPEHAFDDLELAPIRSLDFSSPDTYLEGRQLPEIGRKRGLFGTSSSSKQWRVKKKIPAEEMRWIVISAALVLLVLLLMSFVLWQTIN